MIVTCPACSAQYLLPEGSVGAKGRRVKCTTCDYTWLQQPEMVEIVAKEKEPEQEPETVTQIFSASRPRTEPVVKEKIPFLPIIGSAAVMCLSALVITLGLLLSSRQNFVARFPSLNLLFEKVGLSADVPAKGISLDSVVAEVKHIEGKKDLLSISGKLVNNTAKMVQLPVLMVRASGPNGWLKDWPISLYGNVLIKGQTTGFHYDLKDFPPESQSITLLFAD